MAFVLVAMSVFSVRPVSATTHIKDDTDLSKLQLHQFKIKPENMEVVSKGGNVIQDKVEPNGTWKEATVFLLKVEQEPKDQTFPAPLQLKFSNAGEVYGKQVDVYATFNKIDVDYVGKFGTIADKTKYAVPFLTLDNHWGNNGIQIMDDIWPDHPNITYDYDSEFKLNAEINVEYKYHDGSPMDLKTVLVPTDIDVVSNDQFGKRLETFSVDNVDGTVDKIVINNANVLNQVQNGDKITWEATQGTSGAYNEHNLSGLAIRSKTADLTFH